MITRGSSRVSAGRGVRPFILGLLLLGAALWCLPGDCGPAAPAWADGGSRHGDGGGDHGSYDRRRYRDQDRGPAIGQPLSPRQKAQAERRERERQSRSRSLPPGFSGWSGSYEAPSDDRYGRDRDGRYWRDQDGRYWRDDPYRQPYYDQDDRGYYDRDDRRYHDQD
ncbi:MAG: hypothetical protein KQJ78_07465 [Deltaproteobacteria bacterium]|nr:hypothetical protein [Deltaproteobacteria bacterium]